MTASNFLPTIIKGPTSRSGMTPHDAAHASTATQSQKTPPTLFQGRGRLPALIVAGS